MFDRRLIFHINWGLLALTAALFLIGVVNLYSASALRVASGIELDGYFNKQLLWGAAGSFCHDVHRPRRLPSFQGRGLARICSCPCCSSSASASRARPYMGAKRWLDLGFFNLQPTELTKIAVLILGAKLLARMEGRLGWVNLGKVLLVGFVPAALVVKQPDLGFRPEHPAHPRGDDPLQGHNPWSFQGSGCRNPGHAPLWLVFFCTTIRSSAF